MRRVWSIGLALYLFYLGSVTLAPFDFQFTSQAHRWEPSLVFSLPDAVANLILFIPLGGLLYGLGFSFRPEGGPERIFGR